MTTKRIELGVFGAAFDPPHNGHLDVIVQAIPRYQQILVVPSYKHAFEKEMSLFLLRVQMAQALVNSLSHADNVIVSEIELALAGDPFIALTRPVYSYDVLSKISKDYGTNSIEFILGPDNAEQNTWDRFYRGKDIVARWGLWGAQERVPIRSTMIRRAIRCGSEAPMGALPERVAQLVRQNGMYKEKINGF